MSPWIAAVEKQASEPAKIGSGSWCHRPNETLTSHLPQLVEASSVRPSSRRTRLWELPENYHCSVIGTCLPTSETRRVLVRLCIEGAADGSEHEIHRLAVLAARRPGDGAKFLHKALDRRYQASITRFSKYRHVAAIDDAWQEALREGDIPGPYWAVLTHPLSTAQQVKQSFYDVHMLSHLAGAANRADIRLLRELEARNDRLSEKLERQQQRIRDGFTERDKEIKNLKVALHQALATRNENRSQFYDRDPSNDAYANLKNAFAQESAYRERLEQKLASFAQNQKRIEKAKEDAETKCTALTSELARIEERLEELMGSNQGALSTITDLKNQVLLYVGGRKHQIPAFRALITKIEGQFLHHDGGVDDNLALLPGLISQSNIVAFPVDCVSHGAVTIIKRDLQPDKRLLPLRTASLACLLSTLTSHLMNKIE